MKNGEINRARKLYKILESNQNKWFTQEEIHNFINDYNYHDRDNDKCPTIREDVKLINSLPEFEKVVVVKRYKYKIATKEEYLEYRAGRIRRIRAAVKLVRDIERKYKTHNHLDLISEVFNNVFAE